MSTNFSDSPEREVNAKLVEKLNPSNISQLRRIFALVTVFAFAFCNGLNFSVLSGAVYCIDELVIPSTNFTVVDLPSDVVDGTTRSSLFAAYNWLAAFIIVPTLLACEYGGAEWAFLAARVFQGGLEFLMPYCQFAPIPFDVSSIHIFLPSFCSALILPN